MKAPSIDYIAVKGSGLDGLNEWAGEAVMVEVSEHVYEYTFTNVPGGIWPNIKFAANGNWEDYDFGCSDTTVGAVSGAVNDAVWKGGNIWFEVRETANVTVRLDLTNFDYSTKSGATYSVTLSAPGEEEPVESLPDATEPDATDSRGEDTAATGTTEATVLSKTVQDESTASGSEPSEDPSDTRTDDAAAEGSPKVGLIIGIAVAVIVIAVVTVILLRKKGKA